MNHFLRTMFVCLVVALPAAAQVTGILRGQVLDPSGAQVPNASITVAGPNNVVKAATTDAAGGFSLTGLAPGPYTLRTSAPGFSLAESAVEVPGGRVTTLDVHLAVALDRQEVTVEDQGQVEIDPAANASAVVLKGEDLNVLSDNPDDLEAELLALAGPTVGPNGGQIFVDGFSNGQLPPKESIREIRINSNPFSAEYDRAGFGRVEILTRPGTDRLRGSANFNLGDSAFNSRNPYAATKPPTHNQFMEVNLGGSFNKKTSFNFTVGRNHQQQPNLINAQILDASLQPVRLNENVENPSHLVFLSPRLDYALTPNITIQGRYNLNRNSNENAGVGGFSLASRAQRIENTNQAMQVTETAVLGTRLVNETRFQYNRSRNNISGVSNTPTISVLDSFTGGGANSALNYNYGDNYEFQNFTSYTRGKHFVKAGVRIRGNLQDNFSQSNYNGTFTFTSLTAYQATLAGIAQGLTMDQIRAQGGGARQYSVTGGIPLAGVRQVDAAPFVQDDWRVAPSVTLSLGLRYEIQTNISDLRAWAPRVGLAWGLGGGQGRNRTPKTVLRFGWGLFYDRVGQDLTLQALRQNGITQQNFVVTSPNFYQVVPPVSQLIASLQPQAIRMVDGGIQAPQSMQSAVTVERQLPRNMTISLSYTNTHGVHQLRSRNINAPLAGTFNGTAGSGVYPFGSAGQLFLYESSALFKQNQLTANVNARVNARVSLFGYYGYNFANSNSDGPGTFPANNYDLSTEWSRASFDVRHRGQIGGNVNVLPFRLQLSPNIQFQTAQPFNITAGTDLNGDTNFNDRPAFATDLTRASVRATPWGVFDVVPMAGQTIIPRNYGTAYGRVDVSARLNRTWSFGERRTGGGNYQGPAGGSDYHANDNRGGFFGGGAPTNGRYNLTLGIQARNALNHVNPGPPNGNLSSTLFGQSLGQSSGGAHANRQVELNLRFSF